MKARITAANTPNPSLLAEPSLMTSSLAGSQVVQSAGAACRQQVEHHDDDGGGAQGRGEGQVQRDVLEHGGAEHLQLATADLDGDVVAEAEREREDRARSDRGKDGGQHDAAEG